MALVSRTLVGLLLAAALSVGCDGSPHAMADLGPVGPSQLALALSLTPPTIDQLTVTGGRLDLSRVGVFGDAPADERTLIGRVEFTLPADAGVVPFPDAPYGLYSRTCASVDALVLTGSWRGTPLAVGFEVEYLSVDLRAAPAEYSPDQNATLSVAIDMDGWFDPRRLDSATLDGGIIRVDARHNPWIAVDMARSIADSFTLSTNTTTTAR
jgi:hypothetical protein